MTADGKHGPLTFGKWLKFMFGHSDAIHAVAKSQNALWVGLLFVFSAGLAREYDGEYLLREPWHLLLPLVASLSTSLVLYSLVYLAARGHSVLKLHWWAGYRTLLTFYWMTAPLAWLYAVPVERFLDPVRATQANFALLAIVSVWRVLLITRAISVWLDAGYFSVLLIVLFFADTVLLAANFAMPMPVWDIMGGIRLPQRESIILTVRLMVGVYGTMAWFVFLIAACIVAFGSKLPWYLGELPKPPEFKTGRSMWLFAILLLIVGLAILPLAQPEQARRWHAEHLLQTGQVADAVQYMASIPRRQFPPQWNPPPRTSYGDNKPPLDEVVAEIKKADAPEWLRDVYLEKVLESRSGMQGAIKQAESGKTEQLEAILDMLERSKQANSDSGADFYYSLRQVVEEKKVNAALQERIRKLLELNRDDSKPAPN